MNLFLADERRNNIMLSRLFTVLGHCALKQLIYWDVDVLSELKRRRKEVDDKLEKANKNHKRRSSKGKRKSRKSINEKVFFFF